MSIENKVLAGFAGTFLILFITGLLLFKNNSRVASAAGLLSHTNEVLYSISQVQVTITELEARVGEAVLSKDLRFAQQHRALASQATADLQQLKRLTVDNKLQQRQLDTLGILVRRQIMGMQQVMNAMTVGSFEKAKDLVASSKEGAMMQAIGSKLLEMKNHEKQLFTSREKEYRKETARTQWLFILLSLIILFILIFIYAVLRNNLRARSRSEGNIIRLNHVLEQHVGQLEVVNKDLESFSYSVSHDLRAPLRAINGYTLILAEEYAEKLDDEGRRLMNIVINNATRMGLLIDDLLAFSRLGRKDLVRHQVEMNQLVNEVVDELKRHAEVRDIDLEIGDLPGVYGDKSMLKQVWMNLISNAVKYTKAGVKPVIRINAYKEKNRQVYCIADNGVGFDMSFYNKLFGVFQRLHNTDEFEGTGVGLAIVKRIIHKHKGEIWAEAKVNAGAKFSFSIPN